VDCIVGEVMHAFVDLYRYIYVWIQCLNVIQFKFRAYIQTSYFFKEVHI